MKKILLFATFGIVCLASKTLAQPNVFDPADPLVTYNPSNPPATPPPNTIAKWVRTVRMSWNTDKFKSYYYNDMAFRLRYPNNYNPADATKKYPVILFFHGGGEVDNVTDNEYQLVHGAQLFQQKMDEGQFNGIMLFPQIKPGDSWDYPKYLKLINILDSLQKYVNADLDRVISIGLSAGGYAAVSFTADFPQLSATAISSSPAFIQLITDRQPNMVHIPVWVASGGLDVNPNVEVVQSFVDSLKNKGGDIRYTLLPQTGHPTWDEQWALPFLVPYWNMAHKANPLTFYKRNKFSSAGAINAKIGISGGFAQYQWQRDNVDIPGATSNNYIPTQFGTYRVHFKRFGSANWSDWSPIPVTISLDNTAPSTPANLRVVFSGKNIVNLDWDNSLDNDSVSNYEVFVNGTKMFDAGSSAITTDKLTPNTTYSFSVRAVDAAGNVSGISPAVSATTTSIANGLHYRYYEGNFDRLPDFNALTPLTSGLSPNIDLTQRRAGVNDFFAFVWEGYINIQTAGTYTFETASDDGSKFYFNSFYSPTARALVNNDDLHAPATRTGSVYVNTPGLYPVAITFFEKWSGEVMELYWSGPNTPRQLIPNAAFVESPSDNIAPSVPDNLKVLYTGRTFVNLDWNNSTDNIGLRGYDVFVNGVKKYTTNESAITADSLNARTTYSFTVVAVDIAGNVSAASQPVNGTSETVANGLKYRYYEGSWDFLPNFNALTPVKSGASSNIDLSARTPGLNDNFGFVWEGYINITTPGNYTFELLSDDGSKFYFKSFYAPSATALVSNDGLHGAFNPVSATVNVPVAGLYPVAITFFEKNGGESMQLSWTGPGFQKQVVPNVAFTDPSGDITAPSMPMNVRSLYSGRTFVHLDWDNATDNVGVTSYDIYVNGAKTYTTQESAITADKLSPGTSYTFTVKALDNANNASTFSSAAAGVTTATNTGLKYRYYEGSWDFLPNFNALTPVKTGATNNITLSDRNQGVNDNFGFVWEGYINLQITGTYTFEIISDDGSKLYFNSFYVPNAIALVTNDGLHAPSSASASVEVNSTGLFPIAVTFFEKGGGETMQVYMSGPGIPRQLIPDIAFAGNAFQPNPVNAPSLISGSSLAPEEKLKTAMQAYPNPVVDLLNIFYVNKSQKNDVRVNIFDLNGKMVHTRNFGSVPAGSNTLKVNLSGSKLAPGVYFARLVVNGIPSEVIKLVKAGR